MSTILKIKCYLGMLLGVSIPAKKHGKCPMCHKENTVREEHHEYVLDKKNGKIIKICKKCHNHFTWYFQYLKQYHNYKGRIR